MKIGAEDLRNEFVEKREENQGEDEEEFRFVCTNPDGSPVSADEVFDNGQIRPMFPFFNRHLPFADAFDGGDRDGSSSPVRKLFVKQQHVSLSSSEPEDLDKEPEGPYCDWLAKLLSVFFHYHQKLVKRMDFEFVLKLKWKISPVI